MELLLLKFVCLDAEEDYKSPLSKFLLSIFVDLFPKEVLDIEPFFMLFEVAFTCLFELELLLFMLCFKFLSK